MKCKSCGYDSGGWDSEKDEYIRGEHGDFYKLPVEMQRESDMYPYINKTPVYGCPSCGSIFMDVNLI